MITSHPTLGKAWHGIKTNIKDPQMQSFTVVISTDNDAFKANAGLEIARILRGLIAAYEEGIPPYNEKLRDINGNTVGTVVIL